MNPIAGRTKWATDRRPTNGDPGPDETDRPLPAWTRYGLVRVRSSVSSTPVGHRGRKYKPGFPALAGRGFDSRRLQSAGDRAGRAYDSDAAWLREPGPGGKVFSPLPVFLLTESRNEDPWASSRRPGRQTR